MVRFDSPLAHLKAKLNVLDFNFFFLVQILMDRL